MLRRRLALFALLLFLVLPAWAAPDWSAYIGEYANDGACLTVIQAKLWDTNGAAPGGDPQTGMWYFNTTDSTDRIWTGAAWVESDANTAVATSAGTALAHVTANGASHSDVASNTAARHTQGTDQGLDTGGANAVTALTITGHNASTANPHSTGVPNLVAGTKAQLDAAISDGDVRPQWQTDLFVDQTSGSDVTPGPWGYATIGGALAVSASGDTIFVNPATYAENITVPEGVRVLGEWVNLTGTITLQGDDSYISLYAQTVATGTDGLTLSGVNKTAYADIRYQLNAGTADGISVTDSASTLFYSGTLQTVVNGEGLSSGSAGSVYYDLPLIHVSGTGTGIYVSPTADATGYVGQIDDDGAGTCIYVEALGGARLEGSRLDCATAYNVEATAELVLDVSEVVGTETCTGTCVVMEDGAVVTHVADVTTNPHATDIGNIGAGTLDGHGPGDARRNHRMDRGPVRHLRLEGRRHGKHRSDERDLCDVHGPRRLHHARGRQQRHHLRRVGIRGRQGGVSHRRDHGPA